MAISGTGTGPFTITGTETTLAIYTYVVAQNAANATKNSDSTAFDFNCVLYVGDGTTATTWTSLEEMVRIDAASFQIRAAATLTIGQANPAKAGSYWRWQMTENDQIVVNGTINAYASRLYASHRIVSNTGAVAYFEECVIAFLDSFTNYEGGTNPNIQYVRCFVAGASAVAVKLGGTVALSGTKISGATYAFQPLTSANAYATYTVNDYVGQGNTNDVVPNAPGSATLNIVGAYDGAGVPRTGLIVAMPAEGNTIRLQWKYNLNCKAGASAAASANIRIRNNAASTIYSGQTDASGNIAQQVLTRVEYINNATAQNRYPYTIIARRYDLSSEALTWQADNHTGDKIVHVTKAFAPASESAGLAITGVSLAASGATGGMLSVSQARTVTEIWQYYCAWIAQTANFDSNDTWDFDGSTLDVGAWNLEGTGAVTGNVTTTGTVTAQVNGVLLDANNAGQITVTGLSSTDTAEMRKASDGSLIATRTGAGAFAVSPSNVGVSVYFERKVGTALVMSTVTTPVTLTAGVNPDVPLYAGPQVQVANLDNVAKEATLQALATANQTEHDATQAAIAVVNNGVKNASLLIPHTTNLPA